MRLNASAVRDGDVLEYDLCIIGAGPAGLAIASELAGAGRRIAVLDGANDDRRALAGESAGYPYHPLATARARGIGGSSPLWFPEDSEAAWPVDGGLRSRPLDPIDFERRPGVPQSGWPIGFDEVQPYYARARAFLGLPESQPAIAPGSALTGLAAGAFETTVCEFAPAERLRRLATTIEDSESVTLLNGASAVELRTGASGNTVEHVRVASADGRRRFLVSARQFVVAAGGIENARLLLVSRDRHADGIGNAGGHVGRWFQEHIHIDAGHLWPGGPGWMEELQFFRRREEDGRALIGGLRPRDSVQRTERLLNSEIGLLPRRAAFTAAAVRAGAELAWGVQRGSLPLGWPERVRAVMRAPGALARASVIRAIPGGGEPEAAALVLTSEQAPNANSRVTLSDKRDANGVPLPRLEWRFTTLDHDSLRRTTELAAQALAGAGLGRFEPLIGERWGFPRIYGCWHHIGTTRMSTHERDGVVDERCRVHGMANLHVAGSSVFPTGGATTVTLSLVALAIRLADELRPA